MIAAIDALARLVALGGLIWMVLIGCFGTEPLTMEWLCMFVINGMAYTTLVQEDA